MSKRKKADEPQDKSPAGKSHHQVAKDTFGSEHGERSAHLLGQVIGTLQAQESEDESLVERMITAMQSIGDLEPRDEIERMLVAQMLAVHESMMECFRRAMLPQQSFEGRDLNLKHAEKLASIYTRQVEAFDKHRGKGKQKITVEHVNVHAGGQAIVGDVSSSDAKSSAAAKDDRNEPAMLSDDSAASFDGEKLKQATQPRARVPARKKRG